MEEIKNFISKYIGAIIGVVVAILILCTRLYELIVGILLVLAGAFIGWIGAYIMYKGLLWASKGYFKESHTYRWINLPIWTGLATIVVICITALIQTV